MLGEFIRLVDERNHDLKIENLQGVSITKEFVPSIANIIGTDLSTYKIVRTGQFAYGPVTSRNGDKVSIALLTGEDCIISSSYVPFEVYKPEELLPEYLMMWFRRSEFDRYARFMSNGSAREVFDWECMCNVELPVPPIDEQRRIVLNYQVITKRIILLQKTNEILNNIGITLFNRWVESDDNEEYQLKGVLQLLKDGTHNPPERVSDGVPLLAGQNVIDGFIDYSKMTYISFNDYKSIHSRYQPQKGDLVLTKIGTVGKVAFLRDEDIPMAIHCNSALLRFNPSYIDPCVAFWLLQSRLFIEQLKERITNSVQEFVSLGSIGEIVVRIPSNTKMEECTNVCSSILSKMCHGNREIQRLMTFQSAILSSLAKIETS